MVLVEHNFFELLTSLTDVWVAASELVVRLSQQHVHLRLIEVVPKQAKADLQASRVVKSFQAGSGVSKACILASVLFLIAVAVAIARRFSELHYLVHNRWSVSQHLGGLVQKVLELLLKRKVSKFFFVPREETSSLSKVSLLCITVSQSGVNLSADFGHLAFDRRRLLQVADGGRPVVVLDFVERLINE